MNCGSPRKRREKWEERMFEEMAENFSDFDEVNESTNPRSSVNSKWIDSNRLTSKYIIIKLLKDRENKPT